MLIRAIIMAGGRSERMRSTAGPLHKALVNVLGMPMIERNLRTLLSSGFLDVSVAISVREQEIADYLATRGRELADACSARIDTILEPQPLGTIGAARLAIRDAAALLVVNVDNLTALDLNALVASHLRDMPALTIASHEEPFQIPFGELKFEGQHVRRYVEKPVIPVWVSSGTYVLSPAARGFIAEGERTDIPHLVTRLIESGEAVNVFRHAAPWIDVNHASALQAAERFLSDYAAEFAISGGAV